MYTAVPQSVVKTFSRINAFKKAAKLSKVHNEPVMIFQVVQIINPKEETKFIDPLEIEFIQILESCSRMSIDTLIEHKEIRELKYLFPRNLHMVFRRLCLKVPLKETGIPYSKSPAAVIHLIPVTRDLIQNDRTYSYQYSAAIKYILDLNPKIINND